MTRFNNFKVSLALVLSVISLSLLAGCGGGGGGAAATPATSSGSISGTAIKGPVNGGTVTAYAVSNGAMGSQLSTATTDSQGNFQISIGTYSGSVMLQLSGGTYADEASGATMSMSTGDVMTAVIPSVMSGGVVSNIRLTPLTAMAQAMASTMAGGMSDTNSAAANTAVGNFFMVNDILHTMPMNPLSSGSGASATQDMKNCGMAIAAMSQLAKNLGMSSSSGMVTAMMNDASDGIMNGMKGSASIAMGGGMMSGGGSMMQASAGTSGLATAMTQFVGSSMNKSGLTATDMSLLLNQLNSSNGSI